MHQASKQTSSDSLSLLARAIAVALAADPSVDAQLVATVGRTPVLGSGKRAAALAAEQDLEEVATHMDDGVITGVVLRA